jgi:3-hydroxyacyl-CoA dehydrogenase
MKRTIKKVKSDLVGLGLRHFANIVEVLLLDIVPRELTEAEKERIDIRSTVVRNRLVNEHLNTALKSKPAPIYTQQFANRITTGNTTDDMAKLPMSIGLSKLL